MRVKRSSGWEYPPRGSRHYTAYLAARKVDRKRERRAARLLVAEQA